MRRISSALVGLFAGVLLAAPVVAAQGPFIYPSKGQSQEQQQKDEAECQRWATQQSGFDPLARPTATAPPPQQEAQVGGVGRGAVRGGLGGLAVGAIAGDAGKGAAIGAVSGGLIGGIRRRDQVAREDQAQNQWAQQQAAQYDQGRNAFDSAFKVCLEGRGYTVS
jgi:outer membrane lipoprotein SlyB